MPLKMSFLIFLNITCAKLQWYYLKYYTMNILPQVWFNQILPQYDEIKFRTSQALFLAIWKWSCKVYLIKVTWNLKFLKVSILTLKSQICSLRIFPTCNNNLWQTCWVTYIAYPQRFLLAIILNSESTTLRNWKVFSRICGI
jgi:hypothetical protein